MWKQDVGEPSVAFVQNLLLNSKDLVDFLSTTAASVVTVLSQDGDRAWAAVTLLRHNRPNTVAFSHPYAQRLDETQANHDEGPCLASVREHRSVHVPDTRRESRWPAYCLAAAGEGVLSILALPFDLGGRAEAVLNIYAHCPGQFDAATIRTLEERVASSSAGVRLAVRIAQQRDTESDLQAAMSSRTAIDVAVGIIMSQNHCTQEDAFGILRRASNNRNVKLRELAAQLVATVGQGPTRGHPAP